MLHDVRLLDTMVVLLVPYLADHLLGTLRTLYDWQGTCERALVWYDALRRCNETWTWMVGIFEPVMRGEKDQVIPARVQALATRLHLASTLPFRQCKHETALVVQYGRCQAWLRDRLLCALECWRAGMWCRRSAIRSCSSFGDLFL
jgi:hypothetical protein